MVMENKISTKDKIAYLLRKNKEWVSGENISGCLGISRAAVAKHVGALRHEGYLIESAPRRGYLFKLEPDKVDLNLIKNSLNTKIIGKGEWFWLDKTFSTNREAAIKGAQGALNGSLIMAGSQTNGRGRKGRKWFSAPRSIFFSTVLRPDMAPKKLSLLTIIATLAVQQTLAEVMGLKAIIKWPNDVLVNNKKLAGVLVEAGLSAGELDWAIIGIGCNVNACASEFPEELKGLITSVMEESSKNYPRNSVYKEIIARLDYYYDLVLNKKEPDIIKAWKLNSEIINKKIAINFNNIKIEGEAVDISLEGLLIVKDDKNYEYQIEAGDYIIS